MSAESNQQGEGSDREPNLVRDLSAIGLVALTLMLTVSIVTRSPADPIETPLWPISAFYVPDVLAYPTNEAVTNACGYWGALLSSALLDAVGLASALVIAAMGGIATALLVRGRLQAPVLRSLGGTIMLVGAATAASLLPIEMEGFPVVGAGGYLGAMSSTWLLEHFAPAGAWILTMTVLAVGTLLTTDYALLYAGRAVVRRGAMVSRSSVERARGVLPGTRRLRQPFTDLEEPIRIEGDAEQGEATDEGGPLSDGPKIKFRKSRAGKPSRTQAVAAGPPNESEWVEDEEAEAHLEDEGWEDDEEVDESAVRELEVDDETVQLRNDNAHSLPGPKVRAPKRKSKNDPRRELFKDMSEAAPSGMEDYHLPSLELLQQSDEISYEEPVSYTHLTLPTRSCQSRSRWSADP